MREVHTLKIWPEFFQPVLDGVKRAELRLNDRNYRAGDVLFLREFIPADDSYSGRYVSVAIQVLMMYRPSRRVMCFLALKRC